MGKRLTLAKQSRRNLFTGDPAFKSKFSLRFDWSDTETRYQSDAFRLSQTSLRTITLLSAGVALVLWVEGFMQLWDCALCVAILLGSLHLRGPGVRIAWVLPNLLLAKSLNGPLPAQQFCALLPGFCARKA